MAENSSANGPEPTKPTIICVYCGSSPGKSPSHMEAARQLARVFHDNNVHLVYGGGTVGIMGELARTLVSLSGPDSVHGIIPDALIKYEQAGRETGNPTGKTGPEEATYGRTTVVPNMHSRKQLMAEKVMGGGPGSGFVALSGGYGTMEELMEMTTWNQLGITGAGICLFNVEGFYDGLITWIRTAVDQAFVQKGNADIIVEARTAEDVIRCLRDYKVAEGRFKLDWSHK